MRIYLAGKISKNCWRHELVKGLRDAEMGGEYDNHGGLRDDTDYWPITEKAIFGKHDYVGPYFRSCDHGCSHGVYSHGVGLYDSTTEEPDLRGCEGWPELEHKQTVKICLRAIDNADLLFCWIDTFDCFGTFTEIGYAIGMGVPVIIGTPEGFREPEVWFPITAANHRIIAGSPWHALWEAVTWLDGHYKRAAADLLDKGPSKRYCSEFERTFRVAAGISAHLNNYGDGLLATLRNDILKVITEADTLAKKGSASWRELIDYAVVRPLSAAVKSSELNSDTGSATLTDPLTKKAKEQLAR